MGGEWGGLKACPFQDPQGGQYGWKGTRWVRVVTTIRGSWALSGSVGAGVAFGFHPKHDGKLLGGVIYDQRKTLFLVARMETWYLPMATRII